MIAVVCRKKSSGLFENNIIKQFVLGVLIGAGIAIIVCAVFILTGEFDIKEVGETSWKNILYSFAHYFLIVGPAEEMTFRVGIMECIQDAFPKQNGGAYYFKCDFCVVSFEISWLDSGWNYICNWCNLYHVLLEMEQAQICDGFVYACIL